MPRHTLADEGQGLFFAAAGIPVRQAGEIDDLEGAEDATTVAGDPDGAVRATARRVEKFIIGNNRGTAVRAWSVHHRQRRNGRRGCDSHLGPADASGDLALRIGQVIRRAVHGWAKKEERTYKAAPRSPTKGTQERSLAAAPQTGSVVKAPLLAFESPKAQVVFFSEAVR